MVAVRGGKNGYPVSRAVLAPWVLLLCLACLPTAAQAQADLRSLLGRNDGQITLPADGATGRADFDASARLMGPAGGAVLSAPGDDAILVVHAGGDVTVENVAFRKAGAERFAAYVNGGTLRIHGCRVEGGFDTAF